MFASPSALPPDARTAVIDTLNARLADGIDFFTQLKVAHWNLKGPRFASLHPLFETFATELATFNDEVAERAVILGGRALGSARTVAQKSHLPDYPKDVSRDLEHVRLLADRMDVYVNGLRHSRALSEGKGDVDTTDLLTRVIQIFEKHGWFLRATLEE